MALMQSGLMNWRRDCEAFVVPISHRLEQMNPIDNEKITIVLLPGLNGTAGLFDPLLSVATDEYALMVISYPTHQVKSYEELTGYVLEKIDRLTADLL